MKERRPRFKTEHSGAKNGGGHRGKREEAKRLSREKRRMQDKREERNPGSG